MGSYYHKDFSRQNPKLCLNMSSNSLSKSQQARNASVAAAAAAASGAQQGGGQPSASLSAVNSSTQNSAQTGLAAMPPSQQAFGSFSFHPGMNLTEQSKIIDQQLQALQWQVSIRACLDHQVS